MNDDDDDDTDEEGSKFVTVVAAARHAIVSPELAESQASLNDTTNRKHLELEKGLPQSWFWKQTLRQLNCDTDSIDENEHEVAIAAAAFAIATLKEDEAEPSVSGISKNSGKDSSGQQDSKKGLPESWFWKQTPRRLSLDSDSSDEIEHKVAISAAAFATATLREDEAKFSVSRIFKNSGKDSSGQHNSKKGLSKSWFWKQTPRRLISDGDSSDEIEHKAAISAAAFATTTLKKDEAEPSVSRIAKNGGNDSSGQHNSNAASTSKMKPEQGPKNWGSLQNTVTIQNTQEAASRPAKLPAKLPTRAEAWEMAATAKIRKRYEKQYFMIKSKELEMKAKARNDLYEIEGRMYLRKATATEKCENKVAKIERKARRAKEGLEERKQYEISNIKQRVNKIKSEDTISTRCCCF